MVLREKREEDVEEEVEEMPWKLGARVRMQEQEAEGGKRGME